MGQLRVDLILYRKNKKGSKNYDLQRIRYSSVFGC